jgi:hypothetical protein
MDFGSSLAYIADDDVRSPRSSSRASPSSPSPAASAPPSTNAPRVVAYDGYGAAAAPPQQQPTPIMRFGLNSDDDDNDDSSSENEIDVAELEADLISNLQIQSNSLNSLNDCMDEIPPQPQYQQQQQQQQPQQQQQQQQPGFFSRLFGSSSSSSSALGGSASSNRSSNRARSNNRDQRRSHSRGRGRNAQAYVPPHARRRPQKSGKKIRRETDGNVVAVKFGTLATDASEMFAGDPTFCEGCSAVLTNTSKDTLKPVFEIVPEDAAAAPEHDDAKGAAPADSDEPVDEPSGLPEDFVGGEVVWNCEFCGHKNELDLDAEEIPKSDSRDYVIEPAPEDGKEKQDGAVIFVVDTSGSMCVTTEVPGNVRIKGLRQRAAPDIPHFADAAPVHASNRSTWISRLQCVQAAVNAQIDNWKKNDPSKAVGLVTFSSDVTVFGDGSAHPEVVAGAKLSNHQALQEIGSKHSISRPISETAEALSERLFALEESGPTALGPAMLVAVSMAAQTPGSRVVLCTDGLANVGVGALDSAMTDDERNAVEQWYEGVGNFAKLSQVSVSVISITGDECRLADVGLVAEITGGHVDRVNPLEMESKFASMLERPVIASNVSVKFMLHNCLKFRFEDEAADAHQLRREIGTVYEDSETTFEYALGDKKKLEQVKHLSGLPFQVQIHFTKPDGMKCMRVLSAKQKITHDRREAEKNLRIDILAANAAQQSARMAERGDLVGARVSNLAWGRKIMKHVKNDEDADSYSNWVQGMQNFDVSVQQQAQEMKAHGLAEFNDSDDNDLFGAPSVAAGAPGAAVSLSASRPLSKATKSRKKKAARRHQADTGYLAMRSLASASSAAFRTKKSSRK